MFRYRTDGYFFGNPLWRVVLLELDGQTGLAASVFYKRFFDGKKVTAICLRGNKIHDLSMHRLLNLLVYK